ncbi:discoidin domain-containing protein [Kribbella sp. NPDC005582]|uniref:discoidin domain-containing protein n=1 Tax=Kribbella sp. NPDC005582 TaxID=3156893 RepID=UPI0033AEAFCE
MTVATDVAQVAVTPVPCSKAGFELRFGNTGKTAVYADAFLEAGTPLTLSRKLVSSYLPPGYTLKVPIAVNAPRGTAPGDYSIQIKAGEQKVTLPVHVGEPPVDTTGNLARYTPVTASSEHLPNYPACGAVDGDRDSEHWAKTTGWNDSTKGNFPDWLQVTFDQPQTVGRVDLYTLNSRQYPAAGYGLKDWDVQAMVGGAWQTVAEVRGNVAGLTSSTFTPVAATAVRIRTLASNEGPTYSRVVELEVYGS